MPRRARLGAGDPGRGNYFRHESLWPHMDRGPCAVLRGLRDRADSTLRVRFSLSLFRHCLQCGGSVLRSTESGGYRRSPFRYVRPTHRVRRPRVHAAPPQMTRRGGDGAGCKEQSFIIAMIYRKAARGAVSHRGLHCHLDLQLGRKIDVRKFAGGLPKPPVRRYALASAYAALRGAVASIGSSPVSDSNLRSSGTV